jgi:dTDP-4-dehydrorhamnose 3,5-epimerase
MTTPMSTDTHNASEAPLAVSPTMALELEVPRCPPGTGRTIVTPISPDLIDGVEVAPIAVWPDDRGYFLEVYRSARGLSARFPLESTQVSTTLTYPGAIKAFHYHLHQLDCWMPVKGMLQVALVDLRRGSPTFGARNTFYVGELRPWQILIPQGVGHGYKVISQDPAMLVYVTSRFYDPKDEGRIPYNDASINYDWSTQHR